MSIFEQAVDLGRSIAQTPEYVKMQETEQAIKDDPAARRAVKDYQDLQQSYYRMQMQGHQLTEDNLDNLKEAEDAAMAIDLVKDYFAARLQFQRMVEMVNAKIREGITGICADSGFGGG